MEKYEIKKQSEDRWVVFKIHKMNFDDEFPVAILKSESMAKKYVEETKKLELGF